MATRHQRCHAARARRERIDTIGLGKRRIIVTLATANGFEGRAGRTVRRPSGWANGDGCGFEEYGGTMAGCRVNSDGWLKGDRMAD